MTSTHRNQLAYGYVAVASVFYASYGIWTKQIGEYFDGLVLSALRSLFCGTILLVLLLRQKQLKRMAWRKNYAYLTAILLCSFFVWGPLTYSILHAGIGLALAINYTCLVIGMFILGRVLAGERLTRIKLIACGIGFIGMGLAFYPSIRGSGATAISLACAIISGFASAGVVVSAKQLPYGANQSNMLMWAGGLVANGTLAIILRRPVPVLALRSEWLYLVVFVCASLAASALFMRGLKQLQAGTAGIIGLLEIVFGVLFGVVFFNETYQAIVYVGMVLLTLSALLPYLHSAPNKISNRRR